ncbi:NTP transferase domain-containing protein [Erwinia sp. CPCC 100877]|nr:NTP transferase domain-containing protein [Erwinia sp. CPCC 100877]
MLKISAIIMASGCSARMGANKLFLKYEGQTFLERVIQLTEKLPFFETILVISSRNSKDLVFPAGIKVVLNRQAEQGQSASVRLGTEVASGDGYLYLTVDQPLLSPEIFEALFPAYSCETIVFPVKKLGRPSSPVFFGKNFRSELLNVTGTAGGRAVRNRHPNAWRAIPIDQEERLIDIDTLEDYKRLCFLIKESR